MSWSIELWASFVIADFILCWLIVIMGFTIVGEDCEGFKMVIKEAITTCARAPGAIFDAGSRKDGVLFLEHACLIGCHRGHLHANDCECKHQQTRHHQLEGGAARGSVPQDKILAH